MQQKIKIQNSTVSYYGKKRYFVNSEFAVKEVDTKFIPTYIDEGDKNKTINMQTLQTIVDYGSPNS